METAKFQKSYNIQDLFQNAKDASGMFKKGILTW